VHRTAPKCNIFFWDGYSPFQKPSLMGLGIDHLPRTPIYPVSTLLPLDRSSTSQKVAIEWVCPPGKPHWNLFARHAVLDDYTCLEYITAYAYCRPRAANTDNTRTSSSEILGNFWSLCKISSVRCLTDWNAAFLSSHYLQHYWVYYSCCWEATCIMFSSHNFIDHTYRII